MIGRMVIPMLVFLVFSSPAAVGQGTVEKTDLSENPDAMEAFNQGEALFDGTFWTKPRPALDYYSEAIKADPKFAMAYVQRGGIYAAHIKNAELAQEDANQAIHLNPKLPEAYYLLGNIDLFISKNYPRALENYNRVIQLDRNYFPAYLNRGGAFYGMKQFEKAAEAYDVAIRMRPENFLAQLLRGRTDLSRGRYKSAIPFIERAIQLAPNRKTLYYFRGSAHAGMNEAGLAREDFQKACDSGYKPACQKL